MPLSKSPSKAAFSKNVAAELGAGKPRKQALAIAYSVAREAGAKLPKPKSPWGEMRKKMG